MTENRPGSAENDAPIYDWCDCGHDHGTSEGTCQNCYWCFPDTEEDDLIPPGDCNCDGDDGEMGHDVLCPRLVTRPIPPGEGEAL